MAHKILGYLRLPEAEIAAVKWVNIKGGWYKNAGLRPGAADFHNL